jgi:chromosome segregation ATPase
VRSLKRTFAAILILVATAAFLADAAGLVGLWVVRKPVRDTVTLLSTLVNEKFGKVDAALARVRARADQARQALARVKIGANRVGGRLEESSPLLTALTEAARDDLAPKVAELRVQAAALHDAAVSVNGALETLNDLGLITVPTFSEELKAVPKRIDAIQNDIQELHARIDQARTAASANAITAVTARVGRLDDVFAQIQSAVVKYEQAVTQRREQVRQGAGKAIRVINLLVFSLSALFLVVAAGQVLLISVCWQHVCRPGNSIT